MDDNVIAALARWPNVPDAYGWLSLDARGRWRLHPQGDALAGGAGEPITNAGILAFIGRNYAHDDGGRWFFQNGPQRVFVRLDAAPLLLRQADANGGLVTHTGVPIEQVHRWGLGRDGRLYAATGAGPGMVEDRYLEAVLDRMRAGPDTPLLDDPPPWLSDLAGPAEPVMVRYPPVSTAPVPLVLLERAPADAFGFVPCPAAAVSSGTA